MNIRSTLADQTLQYVRSLEAKIRQLEEQVNNGNNNNNTNNNKTAKEQIKQLLNQIKEYMVTNNITDDKFLKLLCDDLYVAYKSYDYSYGRMYINARLTSQGAQQVYSANLNVDNNNDNLFDNINNYRTMSAKDSPYKTPKRAKIMREVSSGTNAEDDI